MRKEVPFHIADTIKRIDPLLRLRWSLEKKKFVLERKVDNRFLPKPVVYKKDQFRGIVEVKCSEDSERYISWHDGYIPVLEVKKLDRRLMQTLYFSDAYRARTNYIREFEESERKKEEREEMKGREAIRDLTGEVYDHLLYRQGERMRMRV